MKKEMKKLVDELRASLNDAEKAYQAQRIHAKQQALSAKQILINVRIVNNLCRAIEECGFIFFRSEKVFKSPEGVYIQVDNNKENKTVKFQLFDKDNQMLHEVLINRCAPCEITETLADKFKTQVEIELSLSQRKMEGKSSQLDMKLLQQLIK